MPTWVKAISGLRQSKELADLENISCIRIELNNGEAIDITTMLNGRDITDGIIVRSGPGRALHLSIVPLAYNVIKVMFVE